MATRYLIGSSLTQASTLLGFSPERVLRRLGLSASLAQDEELSVDAATYFQFWDAIVAEVGRPGLEMEMAMAYAHGPFLPPIFAFSCADTLALGLGRLADFKPLIGPMTIEVTRPNGQLYVEMHPLDQTLSVPASIGLFELLYITECARTFTGARVVPLETSLPAPHPIDAACRDHLGGTPQTTGLVSLRFSQEDADRPLITRSPSLWESLEPMFLEQVEQRLGTATMSGRIKNALAEALPGGSTTVEDMARRLNVSKRSLQRRLSEEGTNYQELLNETRFEMSERYLRSSGLSVPEISFLLGFRDTSSFFRAFQGWTGMTPGDYRASDTSGVENRIH